MAKYGRGFQWGIHSGFLAPLLEDPLEDIIPESSVGDNNKTEKVRIHLFACFFVCLLVPLSVRTFYENIYVLFSRRMHPSPLPSQPFGTIIIFPTSTLHRQSFPPHFAICFTIMADFFLQHNDLLKYLLEDDCINYKLTSQTNTLTIRTVSRSLSSLCFRTTFPVAPTLTSANVNHHPNLYSN